MRYFLFLLISSLGYSQTNLAGPIVANPKSGHATGLHIWDKTLTHQTGFNGSDTLTGDMVWKLPTADAAGCVVSDGSFNLSITSCTGGYTATSPIVITGTVISCPTCTGAAIGADKDILINRSGVISTDTGLFVEDYTNHRLGMNVASPLYSFDVTGFTNVSQIRIRSAVGGAAGLFLSSTNLSDGELSGGCHYSSTNWTADVNTGCSIFASTGAGAFIYHNNPTTTGGTFTPFQVVGFTNTGSTFSNVVNFSTALPAAYFPCCGNIEFQVSPTTGQNAADDMTIMDYFGMEGNFFRVKGGGDYFDWTRWGSGTSALPLHTVNFNDSSFNTIIHIDETAGFSSTITQITGQVQATLGFQAPTFRNSNGSDYFDWLTNTLGTHKFQIRDSSSNILEEYSAPSGLTSGGFTWLGYMKPQADNTYDIGDSSSLRWRSGYFGTGLSSPLMRINNGSDYFDILNTGLGTHHFEIHDSGSNVIFKYLNGTGNPLTGTWTMWGDVNLIVNNDLFINGSGFVDAAKNVVAHNLLLTGTCSGCTQWITSGSNIFYTAGNVGIGYSSPSWFLDVRNFTTVSQVHLAGDGSGAGMFLTTTAANNAEVSAGINWNGTNWIGNANSYGMGAFTGSGNFFYHNTVPFIGATITPFLVGAFTATGMQYYGHMRDIGLPPASVSSPCALLTGSTDSQGGVINFTGGTATCSVTFQASYSSQPFCTQTGISSNWASAPTTAGITMFVAPSGSGATYYHCSSH